MVILIQKRHILFCTMVLCGVFIILSAAFSNSTSRISAFSAVADRRCTVVIDPGHGGEDGGAVSPDGVAESKINLEISWKLNDLLRFLGQPTTMIRTEDVSIHTEGNTMRARKISDIHHRVELVNSIANAVLVSIHQNSLPSSPVTHGAQVFWNPAAEAESLAETMQDILNKTINQDRPKLPRKIPATIYLMNHVTAPGVLVESGFLSNQEETKKLKEPSYQLKLATAIAAGYLCCVNGEEKA